MKTIAQMLWQNSHVSRTVRKAVLAADPTPKVAVPIECSKEELYVHPELATDELEDLHDREVNAHQKDLAWTRQRKLCRPGW